MLINIRIIDKVTDKLKNRFVDIEIVKQIKERVKVVKNVVNYSIIDFLIYCY